MKGQKLLISSRKLFIGFRSHLNVTKIKVDKTHGIVRPRIIRVHIECLLKCLYGLGVTSYVEVDEPQVIAQLRILRRQHYRFGIYLQGSYELAQLIVCGAEVFICNYKIRT